jgi:HD-GYP domain-containing protein (c-di-GMP phosphodiesterase class II)
LIAQADRALYEAKAQMSTLRARTEERHAQDVFFAIGEAIGASLDPKRLVHNLVNAVGATLDLDSCTIWLVQGNGDLAARAYYVADADLFERVRRAQTSHPMTREEAAAAGMLGARPAYFDDVATAAAFPERFRAALDPGTWVVSVPLPAPREGMFILAATHARSAPPSTSLANAIARLASAAIRNADAYAREKHRVEQLSALAGIGGFLFGEGDFEERLGAIVRKIVDVTGYDMVTLDALDPTGSRPFYRHFYGRMPDGSEFDDGFVELWRGLRPTLSEPDIVRFLETLDGPIMMTDPLREVPEMYREIIVNSNTRSVVVLPVNWQGEMKALMYFASFRENAFDEHDVALMQTIAAQIGPAVQVATLNTQLELSYSELKEAHREAIQRLAYAAEARDPYTGRHLQRIGVLSQALARRMGFDDDGVEAIGYAAVVHDIGKLRIPDSILMKPSALSEEDWRVMRRHPEFGAELLGTGRFYDAAREVALHHHERWDGSGYPFGLVGEEIPLAARIVSVADVYDALISARPYKLAWSAERALAELVQMRGRTLCPATVGSFLQLWSEGEVARIEAETQDASFEADFRERFAA